MVSMGGIIMPTTTEWQQAADALCRAFLVNLIAETETQLLQFNGQNDSDFVSLSCVWQCVSLRIHIFLGFLPGLGLWSFLLLFCMSYYKLGLVKFQVWGFIIGHLTVKDTESIPLHVASKVCEFKVHKDAKLTSVAEQNQTMKSESWFWTDLKILKWNQPWNSYCKLPYSSSVHWQRAPCFQLSLHQSTLLNTYIYHYIVCRGGISPVDSTLSHTPHFSSPLM